MAETSAQALIDRMRQRTISLVGGCRILSLGDGCTCPRCDLDRLVAILSAREAVKDRVRVVLRAERESLHEQGKARIIDLYLAPLEVDIEAALTS